MDRMQTTHDATGRGFMSDNSAGVHPEVMAALSHANGGHTTAYGDDPYTEALREWARGEFGERAEIFPVFNGTGANVIALQAMSPRWGGVVCSGNAHIANDENAALARVGGIAMIPIDTNDGKLRPDDVAQALGGHRDVHSVVPSAVSLTQSTELGTAYGLDELRAVTAFAHERGLSVHVDGARLSNAAVTLGVGIGELARETAIDVVSLGATKAGALGAEAIVVCNPDSVDGVDYLRKIDLHLASKQRFLSAQLLAMFEGDLWQRTARHANAMATRLATGLRGVAGVEVPLAVEANGVFPVLPRAMASALHERFAFHDWDDAGMARLLCAWDTTEDDVDQFIGAAHELAVA